MVDLDREHGRGVGVLRDQLGRDVESLSDGLPINRATVGLDVGGLEQVALEGLLARQAGLVLEAVLDGIGLLGQVGDLSQELTQGVDAVGGDCCGHFAVLRCWLSCTIA